MEDQLKQTQFDPKQWLDQNLKQSTLSNVELNLTELVYNLQLIQQQNEESILNAQQQLDSQQDQLLNQADKIYGQFDQIGQSLVKTMNEENLEKLNQNDNLSQELEQMQFAKNRLNYAIDQLDNIMKLEYYEEEISNQIEEMNTLQIEKIVQKIYSTLLIVKDSVENTQQTIVATKIIEKVIDYIVKQIRNKFETDFEVIHKDFSTFYTIMKLFCQQAKIVQLYREKRLLTYCKSDFQNKFGQFIGGQGVTSLELEKIVEIAVNLIQKEYLYIADQKQKNIKEITQQLIEEYLSQLMQFLSDNFFIKILCENYNINKILFMHQTWISLIFQVEKFCEQNGFNPQSISKIQSILFQPYCVNNFQQSLFKQEIKYIQEQLPNPTINLKELQKDQILEHLQEYEINKCVSIIQSANQRVLEMSFGVQLEDWIRMIKEAITSKLEFIDQIVGQLDLSCFADPLLDKLIEFKHIKKNYLGGQESENTQQKLSSSKMVLQSNLPTLELLISKFEELMIFEFLINKCDKFVKQHIQQNQFAYYNEISRQVQLYLLTNNAKAQMSRNSILLTISNGNSLFEDCYLYIQSIADKIKKINIKILISESLNELCKLQQNSQSEFGSSFINTISNICQNFNTHIQMLDHIKSSIQINNKAIQFIQGNNLEQMQFLDNQYYQCLQKEIYIQSSISFKQSNDAKNSNAISLHSKNEFGRFWSMIYAFFISKLLIAFFQCSKLISGNPNVQAIKQGLSTYLNSISAYSCPNEVVEYLKEVMGNCQKQSDKILFNQLIQL